MTPTITQADRDAAAKITGAAELRPLLLSGRFDEHHYIQALAAHRELGARKERAAVVAWLRDIRDDENPPTLFKAAAMIERGEHSAKGE